MSNYDTTFGYWFSGLCDGEACFSFQTNWKLRQLTPKFSICMQQDDDLLRYTAAMIPGSTVSLFTPKPNQTRNYLPRGELSVKSRLAIQSLCELLDQFPLRSKKKKEYPIWKELVAACFSKTPVFQEHVELALSLSDLHQRISGKSMSFRKRATALLEGG